MKHRSVGEMKLISNCAACRQAANLHTLHESEHKFSQCCRSPVAVDASTHELLESEHKVSLYRRFTKAVAGLPFGI